MTISTLSVTRTGDIATMNVKQSPMNKQHIVHGRNNGRLYAAYQEQLEINKKLLSAINQTIGWVESTGGCEESIRMLRKAISEVKS